ncbi:uncharacterized protein LOC122006616 [Zingiber officinale]|uniref:Uncharacterized protein n=1 Tax=Zingiber officinale TaxID=94328 RepID=A0A8J5FUD0_ZINOF|nr:uncharacterized protein LOC122006616 [Zingiber officinale]KAG6490646.1 hypothetical protein ZIOFF_051956 [Zingiber officinale]
MTECEPRIIDVDDPINFTGIFSEESEHMSISSDSLSSSILSSDGSQDVTRCDSFRLSLQSQFSSMPLSTIPLVSLDKGDISEGKYEEGLQAGVVGDEGKEISVACQEGCNCYQIENSVGSSISSDTSSWDFERIDICISSLNLEREDSEFVQGGETALDIFDSVLLSPSFSALSAVRDFKTWPSSRPLASVGQEDEVSSTSTDSDEPLFWPLDHSLYYFLDFEKFLCPSPCGKEDKNVTTARIPLSKLAKLGIHQNSPQANKKDDRGFRRRIPLNSATKCDSKVRGNGAPKTTSMPSMLSISTRTTSPRHPCNISKRRGKPQLKIDVAREEDYDSSEPVNLLSKEAELFDCMLERGSIEDLIGLNEFDGHEGIDANLGEQLTLLLSPCGGLIPLDAEFIKGR